MECLHGEQPDCCAVLRAFQEAVQYHGKETEDDIVPAMSAGRRNQTKNQMIQFNPYKNNAERAECAEKALVAFAAAADDRSEDTESLVKDLVTDLGHYCDREGLDFEDIVRSAINTHWLEER